MEDKNYHFPYIESLQEKEIMERIHLWLSYYAGKQKESAPDFDRVASLPIDERIISIFVTDNSALVYALYAHKLTELKNRDYTPASAVHLHDNQISTEAGSDSNPEYDARPGLRSLILGYIVKMALRDWCFTIGENSAATTLDNECIKLKSLIDSATTVPPKPMAHSRRVPPI